MPADSLSGPLRRTLDEVLDALAASGARAAVAGGIAQQVWGRIRATRDLDLLVLSAAGEKPVLDALKARGLRVTRKPKSLATMTLHSLVRDDPEGFIDVPVDLFFVTSGRIGSRRTRRLAPGRWAFPPGRARGGSPPVEAGRRPGARPRGRGGHRARASGRARSRLSSVARFDAGPLRCAGEDVPDRPRIGFVGARAAGIVCTPPASSAARKENARRYVVPALAPVEDGKGRTGEPDGL